mmetsp:Transcript_38280/g.92611  ORF Transcript_38280/g.92611 Transcript_38280/m.92611 type:complete len:107 (-) Transcript_38280:169-489(-)
MSSDAGNLELEKKRSAIRTQLHRMRGRRFNLECREFIRAIRYMRLRNDELRSLHFLSRLQRALQRVSNDDRGQINRMTLTVQQQRRRRAAGNTLLGSRKKKRSPPR